MVYLSREMPDISKTKMLKLLYLLDEESITRSGIPFFNLQYKVWKLGPVAEEIFVELSDKPIKFTKYITVKTSDAGTCIYPIVGFCDDEFSDYDINLLGEFSTKYKKVSAKDLVDYTHRENSIWRKTAEHYKVYDLLEKGTITSADILIDLGGLVTNDIRKKTMFDHYIEEKQ